MANEKCALRLEMLGPFRVKIAGEVIPLRGWRSKKALLLLKYLATRYEEKIPSDVLSDIFWPDSDFESARTSLHSTIYLLRRTIRKHVPERTDKTPCIQHSNGLYWLNASDGVSIDVKDFTRLHRESETLQHRDASAALEASLAALDLYRGPFLPEDLYVDWAADYRESYQSMYMDLALRACDLLLEHKHEPKKAIEICRTALKHDPYREQLHRMLIRSLITDGLFTEAISAYNNCEQILNEEFGIEPAPETKALIDAIRFPTPQQRSAPVEPKRSVSPTRIFDLETFERIIRLKRLNPQDNQKPPLLLTISLDENNQRVRISEVVSTLKTLLRRYDMATQYTDHSVTLYLAGANEDVVKRVKDRILASLDSETAAAAKFTTCHFDNNEYRRPLQVLKRPAT